MVPGLIVVHPEVPPSWALIRIQSKGRDFIKCH
jgi:hypothetical protein